MATQQRRNVKQMLKLLTKAVKLVKLEIDGTLKTGEGIAAGYKQAGEFIETVNAKAVVYEPVSDEDGD